MDPFYAGYLMSITPAYMAHSIATEAALKQGDLTTALAEIRNSVRKEPTNEDLRLLMFQILALRAEWTSAKNQIDALLELSGKESPIALVYSAVLQGELQREHVFLGNTAPTVLGEPPDWLPLQIQLTRHTGRQEWAAAAKCQEKIERIARLTGVTVGDDSANWMMDADSRFGPVIEAIFKDTYYWIPQERIRSIHLMPPETLRDLLWARAEVTFTNGGVTHVFIPVRYPVSAKTTDIEKLARVTSWDEPVPGLLIGAGQRVWITEGETDFNLLETLTITFAEPVTHPEP